MKYIVWVNNGCDGWYPTYYDTFEKAVKHESYGQDKIITKLVQYTISEIE